MRVSHSQMSTFQKCEMRFYFEYILKISPIDKAEPLQRGIDGHMMLEVALRAKQDGATYEEAIKAIEPLLLELMSQSSPALHVYRHVLAFLDQCYREEWEPVFVEEDFMFELEPDLWFLIKPDVIFRWTKGPRKGQLFMLDSKFTGQYWTELQIAVDKQLIKYAHYVSKIIGEKIRHVGLLMFNTRAKSDATGGNLYLLKWVPNSLHKMERVANDTIVLANRVREAKEDRQVMEEFPYSNDTFGCKMCPFGQDICPMTMMGQNIDRTVAVMYTPKEEYEENENAITIENYAKR